MSFIRPLLIAMIVAVLSGRSLRAAVIPPGFLDCVVAIGTTVTRTDLRPDSNGQNSTVWRTEGTGFLFGHLVKEEPERAKRQYRVFLVTARHVIKNHPFGLPMQVRANSEDPSLAPNFTLSAPQVSAWSFINDDDPENDVAMIPIDVELLRKAGLKLAFFESETVSSERSMLLTTGVSAGDGIFVLGFPLGIAGVDRNYVIARQGSIARISDYEQGKSNMFLIDALVFPGNSGGPVILRPEISAIKGTSPQLNSRLLGMVVSYIPYEDNLVSAQTHARVTSEENSGLANVIPVDTLNQAAARWEAEHVQAAPILPNEIAPQQPAEQQPPSP